MRSIPPLLLVLVPLLLIAIDASHRALATRGIESNAFPTNWQPIPDLNDPYVEDVAEFAVSMYNKQANTHFIAIGVLKGDTQEVQDGIIVYRLVVEVLFNGVTSDYEALVMVNPNFVDKQLVSFNPINS